MKTLHLSFALAILLLPSTSFALFYDGSTPLWTSFSVPVCWDESNTPGADWSHEKAQLKNAVLRTWQHVTDVTFSGWNACPTSGTDRFVRVTLYAVSPPAQEWGQTEGFGMQVLHAAADGPSVKIGLRADHNVGGTYHEETAAHEFGHVLGFQHEMDSPLNAPGVPGYCPHSYTDPNPVYLTGYDPNSIMNYCAPLFPKLSDLDIAGVRIAYGLGPVGHIASYIGTPTDMIWQNYQNGQVGLWQMERASTNIQSYQYPGSNPANMHLIGTGDFNADGNVDLLWWNSSTHDISFWDLHGPTIWKVDDQGPFTPAPSMTANGIIATGDFNGDGFTDLLYRLPDGTVGAGMVNWDDGSAVHFEVIRGGVTPDWQVVGTGDFNGHMVSDVLWRNTTSGLVGIWKMNAVGGDTSIVSYDYPNGSAGVDLAWQVKGIGDFDGDGTSDIVWLNNSTRQVVIWLMSTSAVIKSNSVVYNALPGNRTIVAVGDFDDDGRADILYRDTVTNLTYIDLMNGARVAYSGMPQGNDPVPSQWIAIGTGPDLSF